MQFKGEDAPTFWYDNREVTCVFFENSPVLSLKMAMLYMYLMVLFFG